MPLTDVKLRNAKPRSTPYKLFDGFGLFLLVHPSGKYWRMKYRFAGKEKLLALGVYPAVSLKAARTACTTARDLLELDIDPVTDRVDKRLAAAEAADNTFEALAREWHAKQSNAWTAHHAADVLDSLTANVFPELGHRPIGSITVPQLLACLRKIETRGSLETAARVRQRCDAAFAYAIATGRASENPASQLRGALKSPKRAHFKAMDREALAEFLRKLNGYQGDRGYQGARQTPLALRLMVLMFVRTTELRAARWEEFDLDAAEWRIPAERMKMANAHTVPLSRQALAALRELHALTGSRTLLFPNERNPEMPMSENTLLYALYRLGFHGRATVHGFRTCASTALNEMGFRADVIERQLAHRESNKVRAAYNRAEYLPERREMMQQWADVVDDMVNARVDEHGGSRVTPIKRKAAAN